MGLGRAAPARAPAARPPAAGYPPAGGGTGRRRSVRSPDSCCVPALRARQPPGARAGGARSGPPRRGPPLPRAPGGAGTHRTDAGCISVPHHGGTMKWKSVLLLLGAAGVTAALGDCQDKDLRTYLGANGRMYKWQEDVGKAICQLETKGTFGSPLDP